MKGALALFIATAFASPGCKGPNLYVQEREVAVRYDQGKDQADVLLVYKGITARGWLDPSERYILDVLEGRAPFIHVFSSVENPLLESATAKKAEAYVDPAYGLSIAQEVSFTGVSRALELWNEQHTEENAPIWPSPSLRFEGSQLIMKWPALEIEDAQEGGEEMEEGEWLFPSPDMYVRLSLDGHSVELVYGLPDQESWYLVTPFPAVIVRRFGPMGALGWHELGLLESLFDKHEYDDRLLHALEDRRPPRCGITTEEIRAAFLAARGVQP